MTIRTLAYPGAEAFFPTRVTWSALRAASLGCRGCPLYRNATQTVFGEGPKSARMVFVGEVPGDEEDRAGHPFVGPAGRVLTEGLAAAGIERREVYLTNVVKHFKWVPVGRRRKHKKPLARELNACFPWLSKEIEMIRPKVLVCLGATAAQALLGRGFSVMRMRGRPVPSTLAERTLATVHPSSILRQRSSEDRRRERNRFVRDLEIAAGFLNG